MRKILLTTGLILIWILIVTAFFVAEEWLKSPSIDRGDIASIENHLVEKLKDAATQKRLGSAAMVLIQNGKIIGEHGFGVGNIETNAPVKTDQTLYLLSSVSKAITAWGIMKLIQDGKLGLDEPVMQHLRRWRFPGSEAYRDKVTVRHLLSHTAGIDDGFGFSGFLPGEPLQTLEESLTYPKDANMGEPHAAIVVREPGKTISYSSAGYTVLQLLIEEISNQSFNDYMEEAVLQPLEMTTSSYDLDAIIAEGRINDLVSNYDLNLKAHPHRRYANMAGVSLRTTPHDLAKFISAYYNDNPVLNKETLKQMIMPQHGTSSTWSLGHEVYIENNSGGFIIGHGGGAFPRTGASFRVNPATGNGIAILMTGGKEMIDPLINDWVYWETGKVIFDIRNVFHNRIVHVLVLIVLGTLIIILRRNKHRYMNISYLFNKPAKILFVLLATVGLINCTSQRKSSINYLGQKPPGMVAKIFAPGVVSTNFNEHSAPAFSPDGSVVVWTIMDSTYRGYLLEMTYENGAWSKPARPSFADSTADDYYPSFSTDGKKLYFGSRRKAPSAYDQNIDMRIWEVERTATGWGNPSPFDTTASQGHEYAHSTTKNGELYFTSPHAGGTSMNIYKAGKKNGRYTKPVLLPYSINSTGYEDGPFIARDESFLIFESNRPEGTAGSLDLYISFKTKDGRWGIPVNMGPEINSGKAERFARLSPDGKYLFFGSSRNQSANNVGFDIYWIDAKVIDKLRNDETDKTIIEQPLGDEIINALYKDDVEGTAVLLKQWLSLYPQSLDATVIYSATLRKLKRYSEADHLLANLSSPYHENKNIIMEKALVKFGLNKDDEAFNLLAPVLAEEDQLRERYIYLSGSLLDMAKFKTSDEYFEKAMAISSNGYEYLRRAARFIFINEKDKAFEALQKALAFGYMTRNDFENEPAFASLKSDARWKPLMEKLK